MRQRNNMNIVPFKYSYGERISGEISRQKNLERATNVAKKRGRNIFGPQNETKFAKVSVKSFYSEGQESKIEQLFGRDCMNFGLFRTIK